MVLLKKRPELRLLAPPEVRPGQSLVAEVIVRAHRPVPVDSLDVQFVGEERVTVGAGKHARTATKRWIGLHAQLSKARQLAGEQRFKVRFDVPNDVPPSYRGCQASVEYLVKIHASIPWWPDARASFVVRIAHAPVEFEEAPLVFSSNPAGPVGSEPHVEASLANTNLQPGTSLQGAVALSNVSTSRYNGIQVHLRGRQKSEARGGRASSWCFDYIMTVPSDEIREGKAVAFSMRIPDVFPTTQGAHFALSWVIEVRARRRLARDMVIRAPVTMWPRNAASNAVSRNRVAPPTVGSPRVTALWKQVASEAGFVLQDDSLVADVDGVRIMLRREARGQDGNFLLGTLTYPGLNLGLDAGPLSGFARYVSLADRVEWPDSNHYFTGRDLKQVRAFAEALLPRDFPHAVADASDDLLIIEQKGSGQAHSSLLRFAQNLRLLAQRHPVAVQAIPAPSQFSAADVTAWRKLAQELRGELGLAEMAVHGSHEGRRASVRTHWSNRGPWQTEVSLVPLHPVNEKFSLQWALVDGALPETRLPRDARDALLTAVQHAQGCGIAPRCLSVSLTAPLKQPDAALSVLTTLVNLELALQRRGAYR